MSDVRALLRTERAARRIQHPHAFYSKVGTLLCRVCNVQLKSDALWDAHTQSEQHVTRRQKLQDEAAARRSPTPEDTTGHAAGDEADDDSAMKSASRKRKAGDDDDEPVRKRAHHGALADVVDETARATQSASPASGQELQLPSRPATPHSNASGGTPVNGAAKPPPAPHVDEDEWAAFEADVAATEATLAAEADATVSAPAISAAEVEARTREEENTRRKELEEKDVAGDREDAARKLEEEFEEMDNLEERLKKLKDKREALRLKEANVAAKLVPSTTIKGVEGAGEEEEEDDDDDDWDGFRVKR